VVIDDDSFEALGARQPLPRNYLADLADFLLTSGARVVAFDVVLKSASPSRRGPPRGPRR